MRPAVLIVNHCKVLIADGRNQRANRRFEGLTIKAQIDGFRICRWRHDNGEPGFGVKRIESESYRRLIEGNGDLAIFDIDPVLVRVALAALGEGRGRR